MCRCKSKELSKIGMVTRDKADSSACGGNSVGFNRGLWQFLGVRGGWFVIDCLANPRLIQRSFSRFNYTDSGDNAKSSVNFIMPVGNNRRRQPSFNSQHDTSESRFRISRGTPSPYRSPPSRRMLRYVRLLHRPTLRIPSSRFR